MNLLRSIYSISATQDIERAFPSRTIHAINKMADKLGLKRRNTKCAPWSGEEKQILLTMLTDNCSTEEIATALGRTTIAVRAYAARYRKPLWSEEELAMLVEKYPVFSNADLENLLPRKSAQQIIGKVRQLNLKKNPSWFADELSCLEKSYPHHTINELLELFPGKTKRQIKRQAGKMGLKKTKKTLARCFNTVLGNIPKQPGKRTAWRLKILTSDGYTCVDCGLHDHTGIHLQAHHVVPLAAGGRKYSVRNGICLCRDCHVAIRGCELERIPIYHKIIHDRRAST